MLHQILILKVFDWFWNVMIVRGHHFHCFRLNLSLWCAVHAWPGHHPETVQAAECGSRRRNPHLCEEGRAAPQRSEGGEEARLLFQGETHHNLQWGGDWRQWGTSQRIFQVVIIWLRFFLKLVLFFVIGYFSQWPNLTVKYKQSCQHFLVFLYSCCIFWMWLCPCVSVCLMI